MGRRRENSIQTNRRRRKEALLYQRHQKAVQWRKRPRRREGKSESLLCKSQQRSPKRRLSALITSRVSAHKAILKYESPGRYYMIVAFVTKKEDQDKHRQNHCS